METSCLPDVRLTSRDTVVNVNSDDTDSQNPRKRYCRSHMKTFLKTCAYIFISVIVYMSMEFFNSRLKLTPLEINTCTENESCLQCVSCDLVDNSSERWRKRILDGRTVCCLEEEGAPFTSQVSQPLRELPRTNRIGAQLYLNKTAIRATPGRLAWSSTSADLAYIDEGVRHIQQVYRAHEYDCLEVTVAQKYLINIQITFMNKVQHSGNVHRENNQETVSQQSSILSYYSVVRFRNQVPIPLARIPVTLPPLDRLSGTTFIKVPSFFFRAFRLQSEDSICISTPNLALISADSYTNYFGIFAL